MCLYDEQTIAKAHLRGMAGVIVGQLWELLLLEYLPTFWEVMDILLLDRVNLPSYSLVITLMW